MRASLLHMRTVTSIPRMLHYNLNRDVIKHEYFVKYQSQNNPFLVVIDKLIVFNDQDHKKIDRGKETHVLAGVRLLGTVRV